MGWLEITSLSCSLSIFLSALSDEGEEAKRRGRGRAFEGWYISNVLLTLENNDEAITGFCQRDIALRSIEKAGGWQTQPSKRLCYLLLLSERIIISRKIIVEIFNSHIFTSLL